MAIKTLDDLFHDTLKDLYYAEKQLVKALPKMLERAGSSRLKDAIEGHLEETQGHVTRLEEVFAMIDKKPIAKKCEAIEGLLKEADEVMGEIDSAETLDAAIISSSQTVEHYEIARYGTLVFWARQLGMDDVEALLHRSLDEEKAADQKLSGLAAEYINQQAAA